MSKGKQGVDREEKCGRPLLDAITRTPRRATRCPKQLLGGAARPRPRPHTSTRPFSKAAGGGQSKTQRGKKSRRHPQTSSSTRGRRRLYFVFLPAIRLRSLPLTSFCFFPVSRLPRKLQPWDKTRTDTRGPTPQKN